MFNIFILDCTLRDGGYINDWNFSKDCVVNTLSKLKNSGVDIIEAGFLDDAKVSSSKSLTLFSSVSIVDELLNKSGLGKSANCVLMIMHGKYNVDNLPDIEKTNVRGIRYCFKKDYIDDALNKCQTIIKKGYDVYLQPAAITDYSDMEILDLVTKANSMKIAAFYIVDTFGIMRQDEVVRCFYIIDNNLRKDIPIGFHSHNNLQLSFSNSEAIIDVAKKRNIIIDSTVFGMGRGAGNLCTELITQYINENIENKYDLMPILEIMDEYIMPIYTQHPWGYSAPYYIAAINNCHPNYATFLMNKQTLCIRDINNIIKSIPAEHKHLYDIQVVNTLYTDYLSHTVDDSAVVRKISEMCNNRNILILAPGKSLVTHSEIILKYISENNPIIFSLNHIPELYRCDKIFISNLKRFKNIEDAIDKIGDKLICTSNIATGLNADIVNYSDYLTDNSVITDNSGLMLINLLKKCGVNNFALAGYDGFDISNSKNYFDEKMINNVAYEQQERNNRAINDYFKKLKKTSDITFITPSLYCRVEETNV